MSEWYLAESAPKDGTHILICRGPYTEHWSFDQSPPQVVHYFADPERPGFYPSSGIVQDSYNDQPVNFTHWSQLGQPPLTRPLRADEPAVASHDCQKQEK